MNQAERNRIDRRWLQGKATRKEIMERIRDMRKPMIITGKYFTIKLP